MTATQYNQALRVSTLAAIKGNVSLHEIVGMLELAKSNVIRLALPVGPTPNLVRVETSPPPGEPN